MRHQTVGLFDTVLRNTRIRDTVLRTAATALIGAGASLLWFAGAFAQSEPLVIAK